MVGRKKKAKTCDKRSQRSWICQLPDDLISHILTRVPTKYAVRTGVLSRRWMNHWKSVHGLDLNSREFPDMDTFVTFAESFFNCPHRESLMIQKLRLSVHFSDCKSLVTQWTDIATRREIKHLDVCYTGPCCNVKMPVSLYTCKTLVHLRLSWVVCANLGVVSLPCLKIMNLRGIKNLIEQTEEKLISGSPVLEDLTIIKQTSDKRPIQVRSKTLKRIDIDTNTEVLIDAFSLECLRTRVYLTKNFKIINLGCSTTLDIDMVFPHVTCTKTLICDTLTDIPRFRGLVISSYILKSIFQYSEPGPFLHQFLDLSRLHVKFSKSDLEMLPTILESCPKLQSLILELIKDPIYKNNREPTLMFSTVPQCLVSSLKFMELKRLIPSYEGEVELVRYFLKNSPILEKLKLDTYYTKKGMRDFLKEVVALPRCCSACQVIVL